MIDVVVPKWGLTMDDAEVIAWQIPVGGIVSLGDDLVELETDKAIGMVEALFAGVLVEQLVGPGDIVTPGQIIGRIQPS